MCVLQATYKAVQVRHGDDTSQHDQPLSLTRFFPRSPRRLSRPRAQRSTRSLTWTWPRSDMHARLRYRIRLIRNNAQSRSLLQIAQSFEDEFDGPTAWRAKSFAVNYRTWSGPAQAQAFLCAQDLREIAYCGCKRGLCLSSTLTVSHTAVAEADELAIAHCD